MKTPCRHPLCPEFAHSRGYCLEHGRERERETHRPRRSRARSVYSSRRWRRLRRRRLRANPICQTCNVNLATDVDHVDPLEEGGAPFDFDNTQSQCPSCHSSKTNAEVRARVF